VFVIAAEDEVAIRVNGDEVSIPNIGNPARLSPLLDSKTGNINVTKVHDRK
jgi:hypothetical protein